MSIQLKRGTSSSWTTQNPILLEGQPGIENRENKSPRMKIGDGTNTWTNLSYISPDSEIYKDTSFNYTNNATSYHINLSAASLYFGNGEIAVSSGTFALGNQYGPFSDLYIGAINSPHTSIHIFGDNIDKQSGSLYIQSVDTVYICPDHAPLFIFSTDNNTPVFCPNQKGNLGLVNYPWAQVVSDNFITSSNQLNVEDKDDNVLLTSSYTNSITKFYGGMSSTSDKALFTFSPEGISHSSSVSTKIGTDTTPFTYLFLDKQIVFCNRSNSGTDIKMTINYNDDEECLEFLAS